VTFERRTGARTVLDALAVMRTRDLLGTDSAAVVTCDDRGEMRFHRTLESPASTVAQ
jgi:uncharacterized membrane protein